MPCLPPGDLPNQGSSPGLPHCRRIPYHLSRQGSPRILEWVTYSFSRGTSQPRDQAQVSHIAGGFFTSWTTGDTQEYRVDSLSLLQRIFLTQESNWGLLHYRWILYQLSYQGSPWHSVILTFPTGQAINKLFSSTQHCTHHTYIISFPEYKTHFICKYCKAIASVPVLYFN